MSATLPAIRYSYVFFCRRSSGTVPLSSIMVLDLPTMTMNLAIGDLHPEFSSEKYEVRLQRINAAKLAIKNNDTGLCQILAFSFKKATGTFSFVVEKTFRIPLNPDSVHQIFYSKDGVYSIDLERGTLRNYKFTNRGVYEGGNGAKFPQQEIEINVTENLPKPDEKTPYLRKILPLLDGNMLVLFNPKPARSLNEYYSDAFCAKSYIYNPKTKVHSVYAEMGSVVWPKIADACILPDGNVICVGLVVRDTENRPTTEISDVCEIEIYHPPKLANEDYWTDVPQQIFIDQNLERFRILPFDSEKVALFNIQKEGSTYSSFISLFHVHAREWTSKYHQLPPFQFPVVDICNLDIYEAY